MRASVSAMTVSRALRDPNSVSKEKLQRVIKAVHEAGYIPNQLAGSLKAATHTNLVAAIIPSLQNSLFSATLQGLSDALAGSAINLMLGDSRYSLNEEESLISAFLAKRPSGLVLHNTPHKPTTRRLLRNAGVPIVETGNLVATPIDAVVSYSNYAAAKAMTEYLISRGYRDIALVSVTLEGNERAQERLRGFRDAMAQAGRKTFLDQFHEVPGSFENGAKAIAVLLERRPSIDAVFLAGDVLAVGAMIECRRRGWAVPSRVAIAGFDDWEVARQLDISITALEIPRREIGKIAGEIILRRLAGAKARSIKPVDVGFRVLPRESA